MNEIQVLGSHNSYHLAPEQPVLDGVAAFDAALATGLDYTHRPLTEQLDRFGIRQFELDVYPDTEGGRFAERPALALVGLPTASGVPELDEPGFKVMHVPDIDFRATCVTFVACLTEIATWSDAHPDHLPIMIMIEAKSESLDDVAGAAGVDLSTLGIDLTDVEPWTPEQFDALQDEILSVFDRERIITPDDVRGDHATLEEAVLAGDAWPALDDARGHVLFALVDGGATEETYVGDTPSLEGKLLFTSSSPGRPDAAFLRIDDPTADPGAVEDAVRRGYLVRTRADVPEPPQSNARNGDTSMRDAAIASGAQYVSTDYYVADPELGSGYVVTLPARCDPVNAPPDCELPPGG
jgi:hypothetical protein